MSEDADAVVARLADAIAQALPDDYVTRWVSLVEVLGTDGERAVWCLTPDEMRAWDTLGLLTFALQMEQAGALHRTTSRDLPCQATVDTEGRDLTPEHAGDYLARCADAALRVYAGLPDSSGD